eukprot:TRINITY_DN34011_c0_g1_i1.p1 TRINITY_DN34011_c0_g1~~TRINITY_DN34011_c0_g1_i1.p1  ORF type:complete len:135 (-),score=37.84 TRINITY_DN34011_c0_g1_i1:191-595(-)
MVVTSLPLLVLAAVVVLTPSMRPQEIEESNITKGQGNSSSSALSDQSREAEATDKQARKFSPDDATKEIVAAAEKAVAKEHADEDADETPEEKEEDDEWVDGHWHEYHCACEEKCPNCCNFYDVAGCCDDPDCK